MRLIIIGASGHGKVVADIAKHTYEEIVFLDNDISLTSCAGYPVLGTDEKINELDGDVFIAVGNARIRKKLMERFSDRNFPALIHSDAVIADDVVIGAGSVVMAGAVINPSAKIGKGCIVNTCSSIDHDCIVEDYCHVSVGAHLCGTVSIGENVWVGAGSTVSNNISICSNTTIGAGAVVVKDIIEEGTYVGVPTRRMNNSN